MHRLKLILQCLFPKRSHILAKLERGGRVIFYDGFLYKRKVKLVAEIVKNKRSLKRFSLEDQRLIARLVRK